MTSIIYCDNLGDPISEEEFDLLNLRSIAYLENGEKKKIEYYDGRKMFDVTYYLNNDGNIEDAYNNLKTERNSHDKESVTIIRKIKWQNYRVEEATLFINKELSSLSKVLYDKAGREICEQAYDINTGAPLPKSTEKYFYDKSDDEKSLWISYESNGDIGLITGEWVENTDRGWKGYMRGDMLEFYFPGFLKTYPYYRTTNFLPETGQSINVDI